MTSTLAEKPYLKIKSLIALNGTNQKEVAKTIGMSRSLLSIKINGRDFTTSEAKKLADYLGVKVDDFF